MAFSVPTTSVLTSNASPHARGEELAPNPALESFDISNYTGVRGTNFYDTDPLLHRIIARHSGDYAGDHRDAMTQHLSDFGALVGDTLDRLIDAAHKEGKYGDVVKYDHTGNRIDEVRYCPEQMEARRLSYEAGLVSLDHFPDWKYDYTMLHRMAMAYVSNQNGEAGINCPLAMTDGMIRVLKALGTEEQQQKYLPMVAGPESTSYFMAGQYVTERVGGSNVGQNRTTARRREDGKWILNGEKWFCSNPGDLWVTTARIQNERGEDTNSIGMFLVPRITDEGELNGCHILRKKDIIGSRGKITVETVYRDLVAEELGRPAHGLANMIKYVINTSRIHVAVAAIGMSRRAFIEGRAYAGHREAYGKKVVEFPTVLRTLAEMQILHSTIVWTCFRNFLLRDATGSEFAKAADLLTPLLKYASTTHATWITHEAMMLHGGNGILGDFSILPRLHNDAIINETWEGTHNIIGEHTLKAFGRPKVREAYFKMLDENVAGAGPELASAVASYERERKLLDQAQKNHEWAEMNRLYVCDSLYHAFAISEWIAQAKLNDDEVEVMRGFALGLAEIAERGRLGPTRPDGIFADLALMQKIVEY